MTNISFFKDKRKNENDIRFFECLKDIFLLIAWSKLAGIGSFSSKQMLFLLRVPFWSALLTLKEPKPY